MDSFLAHRTEDGTRTQSLEDHLRGTAALAAQFAAPFGYAQTAEQIGLAHDIGKYSKEFQDRIRGGNAPVDHSTAGAQLLHTKQKSEILGLLAAYCIAGHHAGLPDGGSQSHPGKDISSIYGRLNKKDICDYAAYADEITISAFTKPGFLPKRGNGFLTAFLGRMLYSCLVDADFLDTEAFMQGKPRPTLEADLQALLGKLTAHLAQLETPTNELNKKRTELLNACISKAADAPGLFTLTAPTGSGKTIASMAFALHHAVKHNKKRVIYVVPYNTIIEQNAAVYEKIFDDPNAVLQHHSGVNYKNDENNPDYAKLLATENWDAPIVVTSSVQFFESLFANRSSKCRKLHNLADSVIVFDEAQMIPTKVLIPCVNAIRELVERYKATAVLATATQSALDCYFDPLQITEIVPDPQAMYEQFRRVRYEKYEGDIASALQSHEQVLCIVNTRRAAQKLAAETGAIHLSTTMYPIHRTHLLTEIRRRLKANEPCRVVSTSLIEAGVDVDFPVVYREISGLDSIIQAGGRCNREGKRDDGVVYYFEGEDKPPDSVKINIAAFRHAARNHANIADLESIRAYFEQVRYLLGRDGLDVNNVVADFNKGAGNACSFPFKTVAASFRLIDDVSQTVYVLNHAVDGVDDGKTRKDLDKRLRGGERSRDLFRALQKYAVSLYHSDIQNIQTLPIEEDVFLFNDNYNPTIGIQLSPELGQAYLP